MAKITYICDGEENGTARIVVDSVVVDSSNFVGVVDSKVHAIQWDGSSGEIEYKDNTPNEVIKDISSYGFEDKHATEKKAQEDAEAEAEAKAKILLSKETSTADWERIMAQGTQNSIKDEFVTVIVLIPVVLCFIPGLEQVVKNGFDRLNDLPEWYQYLVYVVCLAAVGIRGTRMFMTGRK